MTPHEKQTVILYHSKCPDGFGAAYAAWKKFGEDAEYIPVSYGKPVPEHLDGRDVYLVDFCYPAEEMQELAGKAKTLTVLDHHHGVADIATKYHGVFDTERSGATIAWSFFHPDTPAPQLLRFIEDGDTYRYALPETADVYAYLIVQPYEFATWDSIAAELEDDAERAALLNKARDYNEYFNLLSGLSAKGAKKVRFEGREVMFAVSHPLVTMKSHVGNLLYTEHPPFALVVTAHPDGFGVSIRGDGSVDVSEIARKYGGNGLRNSAGFFIPNGTEMPWVEVED